MAFRTRPVAGIHVGSGIEEANGRSGVGVEGTMLKSAYQRSLLGVKTDGTNCPRTCPVPEKNLVNICHSCLHIARVGIIRERATTSS